MNNMSISRSAQSSPRRPGRGRRAASDVRARALTIAGDLLFDGGMGAVTFERVAAAGGPSKTTLYKWWPSPGVLAAEAFFDRVEESLGFADSGDLETDLRNQMLAFVDLMTRQPAGQVSRQLIGAAQGDPALLEAVAVGYSRPRREEALRVLERAQERGQLPANAGLDVMVDQLWGACYHRLLVLNETPDETLIDRLIHNALYGATARPQA